MPIEQPDTDTDPTPNIDADESTSVSPPETESEQPEARASAELPGYFPIVGIGASAGGLAAFEAFFSGLPPGETGMAYVLVQHLAPDHKSILSELIRRYTTMPVFDVEDGMKVKPNCAYIIPSNRDMAFLNGALHLFEPTARRGLRLPIDFLFCSLAQDQHERAIGVVLSGTGKDGTVGIRAIKAEGGMAIAQSPETTDQDGMPRSAIATGMVDCILPPAEMARRIKAYVDHGIPRVSRGALSSEPGSEDTLSKVLLLLRGRTRHDFSQYKRSTITRRVGRRMALHQIERMDDYLRYVQQTPDELVLLFQDLLIGVTSFFRDSEAFRAIETEVIPRLFEGKPGGAVVRVWVPGCSTGEEAYSLAILLQERIAALKKAFTVQVFATDIDSRSIALARTGVYPSIIAASVSPERLARHFVAEPNDGAYRVHKGIRDLLVFSEQDVIKDPPFSRLDLISCRNLLIYMDGALQQKVVAAFHFALNPGGMLFLGTSESVGQAAELFSTANRKWRVFQRNDGTLATQRAAAQQFPRRVEASVGEHPPAGRRSEPGSQVREIAEQALREHYGVVTALVNGSGDILYLDGRAGQYLEPAPGEASLNILKMVRDGLRRDLTGALQHAAYSGRPAHHPALMVNAGDPSVTVNITVRPAVSDVTSAPQQKLFLVVFEQACAANSADVALGAASSSVPAAGIGANADQRVETLRQELRAKDEYLQATNEELETSNEELKAANEEMQSVNEELQSTNEELETSREELQSVNEEMATVNAELHSRVNDLSLANNDMNNLLAGMGVGAIFVDYQLRIQRFTPAATRVINLIPTDIGRPLRHIALNLTGYERLVEDVQSVLDKLVPKEVEVKCGIGNWYLLRIRPYRTLENRIEGAIITFFDITEVKRAQRGSHEDVECAEGTFE